LQPDGSLRVDVPLHFSFDPGKATVKPPLAAVLDRIAAGQRDEVTRISIGAPADVSAKSAALVADRSASVRDYLVEHNLAQARVSVSASVSAAVVRIVVSDLSPQ
jgi:outer membrane protein OmpA-like peptidoglycan-associated protein